MTVYNKLVRDRIPEIIRANGGKPVTRILDKDEFREALRMKLTEEVEEYLKNSTIEELADITEVISALAFVDGSSWEEVETAQRRKRVERGAFEKRLLLMETRPH